MTPLLDGEVALKRDEGERAWKESGETAGMVSVLAERARSEGARSMRAMETTPAASLNAGEGQGKALDGRIGREQHGCREFCLGAMHNCKT